MKGFDLMRRVSSTFSIALTAVLVPALTDGAAAQAPQVVAHTVDVSRRQATLGLELSDGRTVTIAMSRGVLRINDRPAGTYATGGALENSWRSLLEEAAGLSTAGLRARMTAWKVDDLAGPDVQIKQQIDQAFRQMPAAGPETRSATGIPPRPDAPPPPDLGDLGDQVGATVARAVATAEQAGRAAAGPRLPTGTRASRGVGGVGNNVAGLVGMFVALACIAFGLVSFAPRQLEAVADTVHRSFLRSFFAGLFAQPLLVPALGMLVAGLVLTILGIIVVPVAVVAFALAVAVGMVGGYIALARALGEVLLKRRQADRDYSAGTAPYRASVLGLGALLAIWAPFAVLSWVPLVGWILLWCAIVFTWVMATAGFGATILSRAGIRRSFVRPGIPGGYGWTASVLASRALKELE